MNKGALIGRRELPRRWRDFLAVLALFCLSLPATSMAGRRPPAGPSYDVIVAVDQKAQTVLVGHTGGNNRTTKLLKVNTFTEITLDGKKAALRDLQRGMMIEVTIGGDSDEAAALAASHLH